MFSNSTYKITDDNHKPKKLNQKTFYKCNIQKHENDKKYCPLGQYFLSFCVYIKESTFVGVC